MNLTEHWNDHLNKTFLLKNDQPSLFDVPLLRSIPPHEPPLPVPPTEETPPPNNSMLHIVIITIASAFVVTTLIVATFRVWKYYHHRRPKPRKNDCEFAYEGEEEPLKPVGKLKGLDLEMQILQEPDKMSKEKKEEVGGAEGKPDEVTPIDDVCDKAKMLDERAKKNVEDDAAAVAVQSDAIERPKTLKFLAASVAFQYSTVAAVKRLPYTPDPDCSICVLDEPLNSVVNGDSGDKLTPLSKPKFLKRKMKPRGLLERRGSNVALTITLRSSEKAASANGAASINTKSPKPLAYLQRASSPLAPDELHSKSCDTLKLQQEFWEIPMNHPSEKDFNVPGHGTKNRYRTILPNEHSRVKLVCTVDDDPLSGYINANYIRDCADLPPLEADDKNGKANSPVTRENAAFIATQGPMANTIGDFWRMVWQEGSASVVMITKLKERKEKCAQYLPLEVDDVATYDDNLTVKVSALKKHEHFTTRQLELTRDDETRTLRHFWYTTWMDHETPEKTRGLLELVQDVSLWSKPTHGPLIVHCSAGIGRTGCYIAVTFGCQQLMKTGKTDILRLVSHMRLDRGGMIQTWEQYQFVHQALSRYARILAGENVTTPSTTGSVRSPPDRFSKAHLTVDVPRPSTPKHRRSLSESNLPSPKELRLNFRHGSASSGNKNPDSEQTNPADGTDLKPMSNKHEEQAPSGPVLIPALVKTSSSPTIHSPLGRLCLQAKDLNAPDLSKPDHSVKKEDDSHESKLNGKLDASNLPDSRSGASTPKNGLNFARQLSNHSHQDSLTNGSPADASKPSDSSLFSFDLSLARSAPLENKEQSPVDRTLEQGSPGHCRSAVNTNANNSRFFFPSASET